MKPETYYPLYKVKSEFRDVALLEFEHAQRYAWSRTKIYSQFSNVSVGIATVILTIIFNRDKLGAWGPVQREDLMVPIIFFILGCFGVLHLNRQ